MIKVSSMPPAMHSCGVIRISQQRETIAHQRDGTGKIAGLVTGY